MNFKFLGSSGSSFPTSFARKLEVGKKQHVVTSFHATVKLPLYSTESKSQDLEITWQYRLIEELQEKFYFYKCIDFRIYDIEIEPSEEILRKLIEESFDHYIGEYEAQKRLTPNLNQPPTLDNSTLEIAVSKIKKALNNV
ncbi:hypothetical protein EXU57_21925 [Segetibacter sp. 3557_3]|uniref:hypothetical protein n=1 Tax=Segetibacter sp. 3557_3 TaxID=2547429 RepID=UPI001058E936|nr:hypothetical protein [Segetibacter sp. 3557_3]TDH20091.1 hypothetical protein EXU57_21925 [Segetibacter sp. 3557_3]